MFKMWRQVRILLKKEQGATIVEVSFIIPLLLFFMAGIFLFSLYFLDLAAVKKDTIVIVQQERDTLNFSKLMVAKRGEYQKKEQLEQRRIEIKVSGKLPWKGLSQYMQTEYKSTIKTIGIKDRRKQWMWGAEILFPKEE